MNNRVHKKLFDLVVITHYKNDLSHLGNYEPCKLIIIPIKIIHPTEYNIVSFHNLV